MFIKLFLLSFMPLFFAVDAIAILPVFLGLTEGMDRPARELSPRASGAGASAARHPSARRGATQNRLADLPPGLELE